MHPLRLLPILSAVLITLAGVPAHAEVLITINKSTQHMVVEVDGVERWNWPVSTGRLGYDTPNGHFTAFRMEADHYSKEWDDAPMPHSIFFTKLGHAIHGYLDTRKIGTPASHGCVRLDDANAAKLFALVEEEGVTNAKVIVTGDVHEALGRGKAVRDADADNARDTGPSGETRRRKYTRQVQYPPRSDRAYYPYAPRYFGYAPQYQAPQYQPYYRPFQYGY
jgi:hypothetical protein